MYICALHACRCLQGPEEDVGSPGTGGVSHREGCRQVRAIVRVAGRCEPSCRLQAGTSHHVHSGNKTGASVRAASVLANLCKATYIFIYMREVGA